LLFAAAVWEFEYAMFLARRKCWLGAHAIEEAPI
jgi:hypothetical protein